MEDNNTRMGRVKL